MGRRGLPGNGSLAKLLGKGRGVRSHMHLPNLSVGQILEWADAYYEKYRKYPNVKCGPVEDAPGETWSAISQALHLGLRGLRGGSSLADLLAKERGVRNIQDLPHLSVEQILEWADAYYQKHRKNPNTKSGPIEDAPGETWANVNTALYKGVRGLPGGSSLADLLAKERGVRNIQDLPRLSVEQILQWVDAYYERHGEYPNRNSGPVEDSGRETWMGVNQALLNGGRGLPSGSSLAKLLAPLKM